MSDSPYRAIILAHAKAPRGRGPLDPCDAEVTCHNPLCGDRVTIRLRISGKNIETIRFEARGCAIAIASASILCEHAAGSRRDALSLAIRLIAAVKEGASLSREALVHSIIHADSTTAHIANSTTGNITESTMGNTANSITGNTIESTMGNTVNSGAGHDALQALADIHGVRARRRCATLAWEALSQALHALPQERSD